MSKIYSLVTDNLKMKELIWTWYGHTRRKPEIKMFWESQEKFDAKLKAYDEKRLDLIIQMADIYKEDYPDFYPDWDMFNVGFGRGQEKTFVIYISKRKARK